MERAPSDILYNFLHQYKTSVSNNAATQIGAGGRRGLTKRGITCCHTNWAGGRKRAEEVNNAPKNGQGKGTKNNNYRYPRFI